ncbi:MAG: helix-turn-helix transcriptional regulator [Sulfitobacter sp.]
MSLRAHLHQVADCTQIETLWGLHCAKMAQFGFDRLLYGYTRYGTPQSFGDPDDFIVLSNHPSGYTDTYVGQRLYFHGPMVNWAVDHVGAGSWSVLHEKMKTQSLTPSQQQVVDFNYKWDVTAGYSISFNCASTRSMGAISLTARKGMEQSEVEEIWAEHGDDILLMNNVAHLKILTLPYIPPGRVLTQRQREALQWVGDGKTTQDIATIMGLTTATVEKHLRLAREALSVDTTAQAVLKAAFANQMFVRDS